MFELSQCDDDVGKFDINAKVLGVNVDKVTLVFQVRFYDSTSYIE